MLVPLTLGCLTAISAVLGKGDPPQSQEPSPQTFATIDAVIDGLYETVSFDAGQVPDWDRARSYFLPEAVVVFTPRGAGTAQIMDLEGWIQDFQTFYEERELVTKGFREGIAGREVTVYGNIAHAFVVFEPRIGPDWDGPTTPGVDSLELVQHDGRWWIAAITTQFSSESLPIPERFRSGR